MLRSILFVSLMAMLMNSAFAVTVSSKKDYEKDQIITVVSNDRIVFQLCDDSRCLIIGDIEGYSRAQVEELHKRAALTGKLGGAVKVTVIAGLITLGTAAGSEFLIKHATGSSIIELIASAFMAPAIAATASTVGSIYLVNWLEKVLLDIGTKRLRKVARVLKAVLDGDDSLKINVQSMDQVANDLDYLLTTSF